VTMTMERNPASPVVSYSDSTSDMSARQLREYIAALTDTAERREVEMSETEAAEIVKATWISSGAERSPFAETIRVRVALRRLLEAGHHHPDQVRNAFSWVARTTTDCESIVKAVIRCAERDARANREAGPRDDE